MYNHHMPQPPKYKYVSIVDHVMIQWSIGHVMMIERSCDLWFTVSHFKFIYNFSTCILKVSVYIVYYHIENIKYVFIVSLMFVELYDYVCTQSQQIHVYMYINRYTSTSKGWFQNSCHFVVLQVSWYLRD